MSPADSPTARRRLLVGAIVDDRRDADAGPIRFEGAGNVVEYGDQQIRLELDEVERSSFDELLSTFRVFKVAQPETRRADESVVYLSAVTDAKHAAEFIDALFLEVFDADEDYELRVR